MQFLQSWQARNSNFVHALHGAPAVAGLKSLILHMSEGTPWRRIFGMREARPTALIDIVWEGSD